MSGVFYNHERDILRPKSVTKSKLLHISTLATACFGMLLCGTMEDEIKILNYEQLGGADLGIRIEGCERALK